MSSRAEMASPYRSPTAAPRVVQARCCGQCHPAVGGCLAGLYFGADKKRPGRIYQDSAGREKGTPPAVFVDGRWMLESAFVEEERARGVEPCLPDGVKL